MNTYPQDEKGWLRSIPSREQEPTRMNTTNQSKNQVITRDEFNYLCDQFPTVERATYQAGCDEYFVAEYRLGANQPSRLVHYFEPICC